MNYRKTIIKIATFLGGIYFFLEFVLPPKIGNVEIAKYHDQISWGFVAIGAVAVGLGLINLLAVHGTRLLFKKKGWQYSIALLAGLFSMLTIMSIDWYESDKNSKEVENVYMLRDFSKVILKDAKENKEGVLDRETRTQYLISATSKKIEEVESSLNDMKELETTEEVTYKRLEPNLLASFSNIEVIKNQLQKVPHNDSWHEKLELELTDLASNWGDCLNVSYGISKTKKSYNFLYEGLFFPLGAAMFSLLGFYIASAAYRAFRIRSTESALMMLAAVIVMLGQIPFGLMIWEDLPEIRFWLMKIPSAAAFRAITIGASIGGLVMAFRMWFSIESESFSNKQGKK